MNKLIIVACLAALASAAPIEEKAPFELTHTSDVDGSYSFTFSSEDASKTESRSASGQIRGAYSYIDSENVLQKVQYVADENGFQVYGTNLPVGSTVPVKETPEVLEATAQHFALIDKHLKKVALAEKLEAEYKRAHPELFEEHVIVQSPVVRFEHVPVTFEQTPVWRVETVQSEELPVPPMDDEDVVLARAAHLAEVARITAEHFAAVASAPKLVEE